MRIAEFIGAGVYLGFIALFLSVVVRAIRDRRRSSVDAALFFGAVGLIALVGLILGGPADPDVRGVLGQARRTVALALPLLLLRVLDGFTPVPPRLKQGVTLGLLPAALVGLLFPTDRRLELVPALYFVGALAIGGLVFVRYASATSGVTKRRMQSIGVGTLALLGAAALLVIGRAFPGGRPLWQGGFALCSVVAVIAYMLGVAPPGFVRRLWQYSALTDVLRLLATTPASLPLTEALPLIEEGIATAFGAPRAAILVWDEAQQALVSAGQRLEDYPDYHPRDALVLRVHESQRAQFFEDAPRMDPVNAGLYQRLGSRSVLAAPIRSARQRIGVLTLFSPRAAVFSADDLPLIETVSEQVAAFFVRSELVHQAVAVEAQAEATQLKEDFLAAAAHDLRTPLTGILGRAQLLLRRAEREPGAAPQRITDLRALVADGKRMQRLTEGLLEVSRADQGQFSGTFVETSLRPLVEAVVSVAPHASQTISVEGDARAMVDEERFQQVIQNLVDNAVKFTPGGGHIRVAIGESPAGAWLVVEDSGLGLSRDDLVDVFERFRRGSAAARGRVAGMGIGLYLCRRIVEEHGGTIRAEQRAEGGSRFIVELPRVGPAAASDRAAGIAPNQRSAAPGGADGRDDEERRGEAAPSLAPTR